ncbi:hypothetical protein JVT61DRAFT_6391 [Boletus reticuloceps]|uniref:Uncharacterized protein n=1 Tax=Boletus reticuloceps TaxID=495285 RepID=A0A8I2YM06_9AGAM|nr:hypothetical protein JVT61DRAFT_6391 [Boletus reticuloceps]
MANNTQAGNNPFPPGMNSLATVRPCLRALMIGHTFLVLLMPLLVALFYYSTPYSRRRPIFILNVFAVALAITAGVVSDAVNIHMILSPQIIWPVHLQIAAGFTGNFQAMLVDAILLVRLITVHPLSRVGFVRFALLTSLPITLKVARVVNSILYMNQLTIMANDPNALQAIGTAWLTLPYIKIEWIAQVVDNSYASIAFIWTIRTYKTDTMPWSLMSALTFRQSSLAARIRILTNFALSNFIVPTLISVVQLVLLFRVGAKHPFLVNDIALVNARVSAFGVVFATIWAGKEHRREANTSLNLLPVEHEQQCTHALDGWRGNSHPPITLANIENNRSDDIMSSTSEKDMCNQDDSLVEARDTALLRQHARGDGFASQDLRSSALCV